jgi:hypothetical protein
MMLGRVIPCLVAPGLLIPGLLMLGPASAREWSLISASTVG